MKTDVEVAGATELARAFRRAGDREVPKAIRRAHKATAEQVVPFAESEAPRRTGRLAASIGARATQKVGRVKAGSAVRVPYAGPIHYGWPRRNIAPNPFLQRALTAYGPRRAEDAFLDELNTVLKEISA